MLTHRESQAPKKALAANSTDAAYPAKAPTTTEPTNDGVVGLATQGGGPVPHALFVQPYVLGANNNTFSCRVIGWNNAAGLWVPAVLAEYDCTAGNVTGVAGGTLGATEFLADTLSLVANMGADGQGTTKVSPQDDTPGHFTVDVRGCQKVEFQFKKGTGTSANALYRAF